MNKNAAHPHMYGPKLYPFIDEAQETKVSLLLIIPPTVDFRMERCPAKADFNELTFFEDCKEKQKAMKCQKYGLFRSETPSLNLSNLYRNMAFKALRCAVDFTE